MAVAKSNKAGGGFFLGFIMGMGAGVALMGPAYGFAMGVGLGLAFAMGGYLTSKNDEPPARPNNTQ